MIAGIWFRELRKLPPRPVKFARVYNDTAYGVAVTVYELGRGVHDNVRTIFDRSNYADPHSVVHNKGQRLIMGDLGDLFEVRHVQLGIADGLGVDGTGPGCDGFLELLRLRRVYEYDLSAKLRKSVMK